MADGTITAADGRTVGFADYGPPDATAVLWCHGGPGSRLEPKGLEAFAGPMGFRLIGIDRPGYGLSSPKPGRSIADWVPDGLAVADHLGVDRFVAVGCSTGGAYSLALAALAPDRVLGAIPTCGLTDMRSDVKQAMPPNRATQDVWAALDREMAIAIATEEFGADGKHMLDVASQAGLCPADEALLANPSFADGFDDAIAAMFAQGAAGYADDRIADGVGWGSFDVNAIRCPVVVLHGGSDTVVPVANAEHTASVVPGARLHIEPDMGHFSIVGHVFGELPNMPRV